MNKQSGFRNIIMMLLAADLLVWKQGAGLTTEILFFRQKAKGE
jgi:environmental stress-induced protein Ves